MGAGGGFCAAFIFAPAIGFMNFPPSVMGPLQGLIYSVLVIAFLFLRPQGLTFSLKKGSQ